MQSHQEARVGPHVEILEFGKKSRVKICDSLVPVDLFRIDDSNSPLIKRNSYFNSELQILVFYIHNLF